MASPFDQFAKDILDLLLSAHGRVETEVEAPALRAQRADLLFEPDPTHNAARRALGLLGRMTDVCCLLEPFRGAPDPAEVVACIRKLLNHRHARALLHRLAAERSWLLCAGRPDRALAGLRATPMRGWPRGFYELNEWMPVFIVVLSELEENADTLALRLMGAGLTWRRALVDLQHTPAGEMRDALVRRVVELHHDRAQRTIDDPEEDEFMKSLPFVEALEERCRAEGRSQGISQGLTLGRSEGTLLALVRIVERRLRRELSAPERDALRTRLDEVGERAVDDALDLDARALEAWIARGPS